MITIAEVIEQCASLCDAEAMTLWAEGGNSAPGLGSLQHIAAAIRALAAQYEGCIVAEGDAQAWMSPGKERLEFSRKDTVYGSHTISLYRARETQR